MTDDEHRDLMRRLGVPDRLSAPRPSVGPPDSSSVGSGEPLSSEYAGIRRVMDSMRARGETEADVQTFARNHDRRVRQGLEPIPER